MWLFPPGFFDLHIKRTDDGDYLCIGGGAIGVFVMLALLVIKG